MLRKVKKLFGSRETSSGVPENDAEQQHIKYTLELEQTLRTLEAYLHESDDPTEIMNKVLKTACDFYDGDWAGFLQVDLELGLWTPYVWYNPHPSDRTTNLLRDVESSEFLNRWIKAMHENEAITIRDVADIKDQNLVEYNLYQRLEIHSVLAVPIKPRPTGFLAVRNPKRFICKSSMLQMLAYVILVSINEQKYFQSMKMALSPASIEHDTDVIINLFGNLEIYTSKGVLRESDLKSPKCCRLIAYMLLNKKKTIPPREILDAVWPEEVDSENSGNNIRNLIFRSRQTFSLISSYPLIETTPNGYRFNPKLNITTDFQQFDRYWEAAQQTTSTVRKVEILKQAIELYKGNLLLSAESEHWLMLTSNYYNLRYRGMVNELLKTLNEEQDYYNLQKYAAQSLGAETGNMMAYYWLIYAMYKLGASEMAKSEIAVAHENLTDEEFDELNAMIEEINVTPVSDRFHNTKNGI